MYIYFNKNDKDEDEMRKLNKRKRLPSVECIHHFYLYLMYKYFGTNIAQAVHRRQQNPSLDAEQALTSSRIEVEVEV